MKRLLRWRRLELSGFGVWKGTTRFRFPAGLGVLCLPNERGKSTLVAGLEAVLFGLPGEADPNKSGIGRYRSWSRPEVCRGRLDLEVDGRILRIQREMITHRTVVEEIDADDHSVELRFEGIANPGARAAGRQAYEEFLKGLLGDLADPELFSSTFVIEHPVVPAGQMGTPLGKLIGGVGRIGGQDAQRVLFETVKSLTLATGDRGLLSPGSERPTNQRTDGKIEETERRIAELEATLIEAVGQFDRKETLEDALGRAVQKLTEVRENDRHARADLERIESHRKNRDVIVAARGEHGDLNRVLEEHEKHLARARSVRERIAADLEDLDQAPEDLEGRIEAALKLEEQRRILISTASSPFIRSGESPSEEERWRLLRKEHESGLETLGRLDRWARIPMAEGESRPEPVLWLARVRPVAERFQSSVRRFLDAEQEDLATQEQRKRFAPVAILPEEAQEELLHLDAAREERKRSERLATTFRKEIADRRRAFEERYESLAGFDLPHFLSALEGRAAQHRRLRELGEEENELRAVLSSLRAGRRWGRGLLFGLPAGAIAAAVLLYLKAPPIVAAAAFLLLAGVALLTLTTPSRRVRETRSRLRICEREAGSIRERLQGEFIPSGPWLPDDEHAFDRARDLVANREADATALERSEKAILDAEWESTGAEIPEIDSAEIEGTEFEIGEQTPDSLAARFAAHDRLEMRAKEISKACGMPAPEAVREYRKLSATLHRIDQQREEALREILGPDRARELMRSAEPQSWPGGQPAGAEEEASDSLSASISTLPPTWDLLKGVALTLDLRARTIRELHDALSAMAPGQWEKAEAEARAFCEARDRAAKTGESIDAISKIDGEIAAARRGLGEERLSASGGDIRRLRERLAERRSLLDDASRAEQAALDLLRTARGGPFEDADSLRRELSRADERRRDAQALVDGAIEQSEVVRRYEDASEADRDRIRRELADKAETLTVSLKQAETEQAQAQADLNAWHTGSVVNLAEVEIEIDHRKQELAALRERADAATKAWHLLGEAIQEFRSTHQQGLAGHLDDLFRRITRREGRKIELDPRLAVGILDDGHRSGEGQLSQGARDQLAFCMRLAVADLVAGEIVLPLILDDPFVHSDPERLARINEALAEAARERQVILLTQDGRLATWGESIQVEAL